MSLSPSLKVEQDVLFPFIVNEINHLHYREKLPLSRFAVLVRDRFQGARLKSFLKKSHISFTSTRPESLQGLDSVVQFLQIYLATLYFHKSIYIQNLKVNSLLNWPLDLFEPQNFASLTGYFSSLQETLLERGFLAFYDQLTHQQGILEESFYQRLLSTEEGIYLYQELEQIKDLLLQKEIEGSDAYQLLHFLDDLSKIEALPEKTYPLRQNIEQEGVQLLTLHMSKGLEFDVVFALGLVNQVKVKEDLILHKTNKLSPITSLPEQDYIEHLQELNAEKLRTLYVALTRAKQRLYIPCVFSNREPLLGQSSPMDLFLQSMNLDLYSLKAFISQQSDMSFTHCEDQIDVQSFFTKSHPNLVAPTKTDISFVKRFKHSFTSLSSPSTFAISEVKAPHDFEWEEKNIHTMPAGAFTGSMIHKIMEEISFDAPLDLEIFLSKTPFEPWKEVIEELVGKLVQTPLQIKGKTFALKELKKGQIQKEVEFLYPVKEKFQIEELQLQGSFLHGFMDLVFIHEGMYYLIDYKTNWLGEKASSYFELRSAMEDHNYMLQAQIYQEALKKYISVFEARSFEECFGGVIYWFVRGIDHTNKGLFVL
ncbi:MAG: RecBCD enzyme subunit RecB [Chlamydiae bacterium]|nr:RecBCD enzyme subunit RecB [Chlamydiota bacterium]